MHRTRGSSAAAVVAVALLVALTAAAFAWPQRAAAASGTGAPATRHVVVVGIGGLAWSDVSPTHTPALWRLAARGSAGSLVVSGVHPPVTCPADGWLTLNGGARAAVSPARPFPCPAVPDVIRQPGAGPRDPAPARVPGMPRLVAANRQTFYNPVWGGLRMAASGRCATAVGPGAALALASSSGQVTSYLASPSGLTGAVLARCPLTVIDLGTLPDQPPRAAGAATAAAVRSAALRAADRTLARLSGELPPDSTLLVASPGDGAVPRLRVIVVDGPGFAHGLLTAASTRWPGVVNLTDLTPTVLGLLGVPAPSAMSGSPLQAASRGTLASAVTSLREQDVAAQVYRTSETPFLQWVGFGYPLLFGLIALAPWGRGEARGRRRRTAARVAGVWAASVPAGTLLASLVPWWAASHPAAVLYSLAVAWAAAIAALALAGPWRRDPLGPAGVVASATLAVIALDLITGSHLLRDTPFGMWALEGGRFYGLGNNVVMIYIASGVVCATWLGGIAFRRGRRGWALTAMAGVAAVAAIVAAWPAFGAKVGGTIAMVPAFGVLLAAAANVRVTLRRALLIGVSGLALVTAFALVSYFLPVAGHSHLSEFVGQALHGGAGGTLRRKISSNLGSLTANPFVPVIPVVVAALGLMVAWPDRARAGLLLRAYAEIPLLKAALSAIWLAGVASWLAEDSGATVPAAAFPLVLPLAVVILSSLPARDEPEAAAGGSGEASRPRSGGPPHAPARPARYL